MDFIGLCLLLCEKIDIYQFIDDLMYRAVSVSDMRVGNDRSQGAYHQEFPIPLLLVCKGLVTGPTEAESSALQATSLGYSRDDHSLMTVVRKRLRSGIRVELSSVLCITSLIDNLTFRVLRGLTSIRRLMFSCAAIIQLPWGFGCSRTTDGPCA